ncbi:MAG: hypothetical protein WCB12_17945, partial [Bryobacteraceae bacterium]
TAPATTVYSPENEQENPAKGARHCANQISALQAHSWIRKCCGAKVRLWAPQERRQSGRCLSRGAPQEVAAVQQPRTNMASTIGRIVNAMEKVTVGQHVVIKWDPFDGYTDIPYT